MKKNFNDFINSNPNCSGLFTSSTAKAIFNFLSDDENIIKMLESSDAEQPALSGCVLSLEAFYGNLPNKDMDLDDFNKQAIGRMIKTILEPFGYIPTKQKNLSKSLNSKYFKSAKCYALLKPAYLKVVKKIIRTELYNEGK